jgi:adenosylcobinamide-GDP ribazoletransferase
LFLTAVMFYTRLPCPRWVGYSDEQLNRSTTYFPAIGWLVGTAMAAVIALAHWIVPWPVAVVIGVAVSVVMTGAFHEDGFADVCDGFGGGVGANRVLEIMKDSRVGAFAVLGLVLLFALKLTGMTYLIQASGWWGLAGLVFAHVLSRWCAVTIIFRGVYARHDQLSKTKPIGRQLSFPRMVAATVWLLPFIGLAWWHPWWLTAVPIALLVRWRLNHWFIRRLGGYTGDCLGATQQIVEVVTLLTCLSWAGAGF